MPRPRSGNERDAADAAAAGRRGGNEAGHNEGSLAGPHGAMGTQGGTSTKSAAAALGEGTRGNPTRSQQNPGNLPKRPSRTHAPIYDNPALGDIVNGTLPASSLLGGNVFGMVAGIASPPSDLLGLDTSVPDAYGSGEEDKKGQGGESAALTAAAIEAAPANGDPPVSAADAFAELSGPNLHDVNSNYGVDQGAGAGALSDQQDNNSASALFLNPLARYAPRRKALSGYLQ